MLPKGKMKEKKWLITTSKNIALWIPALATFVNTIAYGMGTLYQRVTATITALWVLISAQGHLTITLQSTAICRDLKHDVACGFRELCVKDGDDYYEGHCFGDVSTN